MAKFEIVNYGIELYGTFSKTVGNMPIQGVGIISCQGEEFLHLRAFFLTDDSPVPSPTVFDTGVDSGLVVLYLRKEMMPVWIDLLRNEKPVYGHIDKAHPELTHLSTGWEHPGEGET